MPGWWLQDLIRGALIDITQLSAATNTQLRLGARKAGVLLALWSHGREMLEKSKEGRGLAYGGGGRVANLSIRSSFSFPPVSQQNHASNEKTICMGVSRKQFVTPTSLNRIKLVI